MPIRVPRNDKDCLTKMQDAAREFMQTPRCVEIAEQFESLDDAIEYIRALDQRDDCGDPCDGPRIQCDVAQRLRLPAKDPACFERTGMFIAFSQVIDPDLEVTSATIRVDNGLHTFPMIRRGNRWEVVILDPRTHDLRNAMTATAYKLRNTSPMTSDNIAPWFTDIVHHGCVVDGIVDTYQVAMADIRNGLITGRHFGHVGAIEDVLSVAERESQLFGPAGRVAYRRVHDSVHNLSRELHRNGVANYLSDLLDTDEPLAGDLLKAALIAQFGPAAAIALYGVDLAVKKPDGDKADKKPEGKAEKQADTRPQLTKPTREQLRQQVRRMTLAFRNPKPKEN